MKTFARFTGSDLSFMKYEKKNNNHHWIWNIMYQVSLWAGFIVGCLLQAVNTILEDYFRNIYKIEKNFLERIDQNITDHSGYSLYILYII